MPRHETQHPAAAGTRSAAAAAGARRAVAGRSGFSPRLNPIAAVLALGLFGIQAGPARAATISVTTTDQVSDTACTLSEAILAANADAATDSCPAGSGADTITLPSGSTFLLNYPFDNTYNGLPPITSDITIQGNGSTIHRNPAALFPFRLIEVRSAGGDTGYSTGQLTLQNCTLSGGMVSGDGDEGNGGGVLVQFGTNLALVNSMVSGNSAGYGGGGIGNFGTVTLSNSTVSGNSAHDAGGIGTVGGTATLKNSTVSGNTAERLGGGVLSAGYGVTTLSNSTVSGNSATYGGGIGLSNGSAVILSNSTVSGNQALAGGGLYDTAQGAVGIYDSTVTGNTASGKLGGGLYLFRTDAVISRSLVSGNVSTASGGTNEVFVGSAYYASSITVDHNLFGHSGETRGQAFLKLFTSTSDVPGASDINATSDGTLPTALSAILKPALDFNGGPTKTHALVAASPAIDAAGNGCAATDQRGVNRPKDGNNDSVAACDIGAYEVGLNSADLAITNTASVTTAGVGSPVTYTLKVTNNGPDHAVGVQVYDTLPSGLNYLSAAVVAPAVGSCTRVSGTIGCELGNLAVNGSAAVSIATTVASAGPITNTGSTISDVTDVDPATGNNTASAQINAGCATPGTLVFKSSRSVAGVPSFSYLETAGAVSITVSRSGGSCGAASVSYAATADTAKSPLNFDATMGTLSWVDGETGDKTFKVMLHRDFAYGSTLSAKLGLSTATGASLGTASNAVLQIRNVDTRGMVSLSPATKTVTKGSDTSVTLTAVLSKAYSNDVTVNFAFTGTARNKRDYTYPIVAGRAVTKIVIPAGSMSGDLVLTVLNLPRYPGAASLTATIASAAGAPVSADKSSSISFLPASVR